MYIVVRQGMMRMVGPMRSGDELAWRSGRIGAKSVRGFTYLGLLFAIVLVGIMLSITGVVWHTEVKREKEAELLFVGQQYVKAINSYHAVVINGVSKYPTSLDDLLEDHRFPMPVRHLRRRYLDPVTNSMEWELIRDGSSIVGLHSRSTDKPIKTDGFAACCQHFADADSYATWKFTSAGTIVASASRPAAASLSATSAENANEAAVLPDASPAQNTNPAGKDPSQLESCNLKFYVEVRKCNLLGADKLACQAAVAAKRDPCVAG